MTDLPGAERPVDQNMDEVNVEIKTNQESLTNAIKPVVAAKAGAQTVPENLQLALTCVLTYGQKSTNLVSFKKHLKIIIGKEYDDATLKN